jgi:hypothetical protein
MTFPSAQIEGANMKVPRLTLNKIGLYVCTLLVSIFIWWVGTALMNELTGALGTILRLFAVAIPIRLLVQEIRQHAKTAKLQTTPSSPVQGEPSGRAPLRTFLRTWRNMAIASIFTGVMMYVMAASLRWYAIWLLPRVCLGGPLSLLLDLDTVLQIPGKTEAASAPSWLLLLNRGAAPHVAVYALLYGVGVAWLFWKPSSWARAVFFVFSVLWWLMGLSMASVGVDGGSSLFL